MRVAAKLNPQPEPTVASQASCLRIIGAEIDQFRHALESETLAHECMPLSQVNLIQDRLSTLLCFLDFHVDIPNTEIDRLLPTASAYFHRGWNNLTPDQIQDYLNVLDRGYDALCRKVFWPDRPADVSISEYCAHITGIPDHLLQRIVSLQENTLIDPNVDGPQRGLTSAYTVEELRELCRNPGARLINIKVGGSTEFFYLAHIDPLRLPTQAEQVRTLTAEAGFISPADRICWCEILGASSKARFGMARQGIRAYEVAHAALEEIALSEELTDLLGIVRSGGQANLALHDHERMGCTMLPLQILIREIPFNVLHKNVYRVQVDLPSFPESMPDKYRPYFGERTPFSHRPLDAAMNEQARSAPSISDLEVADKCNAYLETALSRPTLHIDVCSDGLLIRLVGCGFCCSLRQVLPRVDYWEWEPVTRDVQHGSLDHLLTFVTKRLANLD